MHYHFQGSLTTADIKHYIPHTFDVPAHAAKLDVHFHYTDTAVNDMRHMLCLSLFDPRGFRGAAHRGESDQSVHIDDTRASPGYTAGELPAGPWTIEVDTHRIVPGIPCHYDIDIDISTDTAPPRQQPMVSLASQSRVVRDAPGWYRGDLHAHTIHSDGRWDLQELLETARSYHLDFVTLTDHNTISELPEIDRASSSDILVMVGMELTTYWGHALSLGLSQWIDWRVQPGKRSMAKIAQEVMDAGGLFVIAHPAAPGDPKCTGCHWQYPDVFPGPARLVEVWNGPWKQDSHNERAVAIWYNWLNEGHRITATAGTDAHGPEHHTPAQDLNVGLNVVYADKLSQAAVLQAISRGHLYVSSGPHLELTGTAESGEHAMMGDTLPGGPAHIQATWEECPRGAQARLIMDGQIAEEWRTGDHGTREWTIAPGQAHWCLMEIRDPQGRMLALTNPIFLGNHQI
ncbi:MAG: PHP domain-containing protein [Anaerolineae bacterium]|nr:PHP domain-containing protein [Anaerolineae bacterium]